MVYDWENKEEICYKMYIEEKKGLEDIMAYMKDQFNFAPSKRAFQTQFKKWQFPSKQHPAHKNAELVQRVKELWETNTSQREMLRILNEEDGFDIKERELMRVRAKNRWLLRVPNGMKSKKNNSDQDVMEQLQQALFEDGHGMDNSEMDQDIKVAGRATSPELSPEVLAKRQERLQKLQAESAERWASRKRRRRTRGWAGLPADPPGPPRFPSETTIDESKVALNLDSAMYRDVRARFQRICEEAGVIKKTLAGPERWDAVKDRLIQESTHLQSVFWGNNDNLENKKLSLDVVCTDVTKRMRTLERRMTIAEAKNALGVNPEESRQIRNAFYQTLKADHFTSKLEAGDEHWKELKAKWIAGSDLLKNILAPGLSDSLHQEKVKAMEVLCRDVMKRLRDDQTKRDPARKKRVQESFSADTGEDLDHFTDDHNDVNAFSVPPHDALIQAAAQAQAQAHSQGHGQGQPQAQPLGGMASHTQSLRSEHDDLQIDPSLLLAAANDPSLLDHQHFIDHQQHAYTDHHFTTQGAEETFHPVPIAVYFRLHPASDVHSNSRLWVSTLTSISADELRRLASSRFQGTLAVRLEGIIKEPNGNEITLQIDHDDELDAYLAAINSVKPMFAVQLMQAWKTSSGNGL